MIKMANRVGILMISVAVLGCATTAKLPKEEIFDRYPQVAKLKARLADAEASGVEYLAPVGYANAQSSYVDALSAAELHQGDQAMRLANSGLKQLETAERDAAVSRDVFVEVLEVRDRAKSAGAESLFSSELGELEESLREATHLVELDNIERAKGRRPALLDGYSRLELASLKEGTVQAAKAAIRAAREKEAENYAPKTFRLAKDELKVAESILNADRTQTEKAHPHALKAIELADRSANIAELVKDFRRRDFTPEDMVLWYQDQLLKINEPIATPVSFAQPNRATVLAMRESISTLVNRQRMLEIREREYEEQLASETKLREEDRALFESVQSLFDSSEAEVYRRRQDVLLSVHGFYFPPGKSEIEARNFGLLNKIVLAITKFPDASLVVSGHTDATGDAKANLVLSEARAAKVADFLTEVGGIASTRIKVQGFGEERPVASNETDEGRSRNRRVEVLIVNR